ncbi:MAG: adenylyl-sulfate kinase [Rhodospirillales bacterium]|nr:adenylyl-sulfate kinase [Rhodospirillales bacterium]
MERKEAFAVWVTGLPASGKSTLVASLRTELAARGVDAAVLESDVLRPIFTPQPRYDEQEREAFYRQMIWVGALLVHHGVPVIFDATANRRAHREQARLQIPRFLEVYVECPLEVCMARDPKGIYRHARQGEARHVPGLQVPYEPPLAPDLVIRGDTGEPSESVRRIIETLFSRRYL